MTNFFNDATSPEIQTQLSSMIKCTPENSQFQNCSWLVAPAKSFGESGYLVSIEFVDLSI